MNAEEEKEESKTTLYNFFIELLNKMALCVK